MNRGTTYARSNWWVWSDTHFGHGNIVKFQQRPANHEVIMLSEWIRMVRDDDTILHLGDLFMGRKGNPKRWLQICTRMPGRKLLVLGNHDTADLLPLYRKAGFEIVDPFISEVKGTRVAFTHRPMTGTYRGAAEPGALLADGGWDLDEWDVNVHGHIHGNDYGEFDEGSLHEGKRYVNVSVEAIDLRPRQVGGLL